MELKEIKQVIDLMSKNGLTEFELERDNFKIRICKTLSGGTIISPVPMPIASPAVAAPPASNPSTPPAADLPTINSPMVGTFYRAPSPDSPNFVEVGAEVNPDTVVCIIEAMKVMNEIKAEVSGVITEVMTENGKPIEFGQPLFKIRPR